MHSCLLEIKCPSLREAAGNARACSRFRSRGHKKVVPSPTLRALVMLTLVHIPVDLIRLPAMFKDIAKGPPQAFKTAKHQISLPVLRSDLDAAK